MMLHDYMIDHLDGMAIFLGTHNEESTYNLIEHMKSKIQEKKRIWQPTLWYGDNISYNLADHSIILQIFTFGPVKQAVLTYRAEENTSVAGQTSRELGLIKAGKEEKKE
jgi:proline dehydrogenase